jgi:Bacterial dnaA protein helix-turn-helix
MGVLATRDRDRGYALLAAGVAGFALGVPRDEVISELRGSSSAAFARQVAIYIAHVAFELSLARVAIAFGRDRSTVAHACHVIEDRREDEAFDDWIGALEASLREAPAPQRPAMAQSGS